MKEKIKEFGMASFGVIIFIASILFIFFIIKGGLWLSRVLYPWLTLASKITFIVSFFILLPLIFFKKTKIIAIEWLLIASNIFGIILWIWSFLLTYFFWGYGGLVCGILIGRGMGVVLIAIFTSLFHGEWAVFSKLILLLVIMFGIRFSLIYFFGKENKFKRNKD